MKFRALLAVLALAVIAIVTIPKPSDAAELVALDDFGTTCLPDAWLDDCIVDSAGYLNATGDAPHIAFQLQTGSAPGGGAANGIVLLQAVADGWTELASQNDGAFYSTPRLSDGPLLHVPGYQYGTAGNNADLLFQWNAGDATWHAIDLTQWQDGIVEKLPKGLAIWKGVAYDFADPWLGLFARTSLWQESDANCCATGGSAEIAFTIVDDVLVAGDVTFTPPPKTAP